MKVAQITLVSFAGAVAIAQPSVPVAPVPEAVTPAGNDLRGNPFLAPGPFPVTVQATKLDLFADPNGGVLDGANSNYVRVDGVPLGLAMSGATNEGDMDINMSLNPILLDPSEPRSDFAFPNTNWDSIVGEQASYSVNTGGEPTYGWAATSGAGVLWCQVADNGRDNGFSAFGSPTGTLFAHAQAASNSFRGGPGYNMITGEYGNGNGSIYASIHALGFATEYVIDVSFAWFPYQEGWVAGSTMGGATGIVSWVENSTGLDPMSGEDVNWPSRGPDLPDDASDIVTLAGTGNAQGSIGFMSTDLGITPANAMLFTQSGNDTNDAGIPGLVEAGDGWNFAFRRDAFSPDFPEEDEFVSAASTLITFIALPYDTTNLQGGKVDASGVYANVADDNFTTISRVSEGTYELEVMDAAGRGIATEDGMLMLQSLLAQDGDATDPNRNILSYEFDAARGVYVIESRIMERDDNGNVFLESYPLIDSPFYVAYVDFDSPPTLSAVCAADLTGDGELNFFDVSAFLVQYNDGADYNGDGSTNFFDVSAFLADYQAGCP